MIIDCHGHYTTAPKALEDWRSAQIAGIADASKKLPASQLKISDDELRETIEGNQSKIVERLGELIRLIPVAGAQNKPLVSLKGPGPALSAAPKPGAPKPVATPAAAAPAVPAPAAPSPIR